MFIEMTSNHLITDCEEILELSHLMDAITHTSDLSSTFRLAVSTL
jgi:hypothetical protein